MKKLTAVCAGAKTILFSLFLDTSSRTQARIARVKKSSVSFLLSWFPGALSPFLHSHTLRWEPLLSLSSSLAICRAGSSSSRIFAVGVADVGRVFSVTIINNNNNEKILIIKITSTHLHTNTHELYAYNEKLKKKNTVNSVIVVVY